MAAGVFAAFGIGVAWSGVSDWSVSAPLVLFYGVLIVNTYFSVRCFARVIAPGDRLQQGVDAVLIAIYAGLAWSFGDPRRFATVATFLFAIATLKYALMLGRVDETPLLARKLRVDALGTIACAWALGGMLAGYDSASSWGLATANALANVYVLRLRPIYRVENA